MVSINIVVITAIIVLIQVLGLCAAAPFDPVAGASINFGNESASRVEKNEGATLLMRRAPCFGNLCGKKDEERSPSSPTRPSPGREERGDKFMDKVRGVIKDGWKSAGNVAGKAWHSAATGSRNAMDFVTGGLDSGTVIRTPSRPKKTDQAKNADQSNQAGPSLWTKPPTQRESFGHLPLDYEHMLRKDLIDLRRAAMQIKKLQRGIDQDDQRLMKYGSLKYWDPKEYEKAREDRIAKEVKQWQIKEDMKAFTNHLKLPGPKGKGHPKSPGNDKEKPPTREIAFHPKLPTGAGPSEPVNGRTSESALIPASRPILTGTSDSAGNRSPGPRPARANVVASKPDRVPVPASVRAPAHLAVAGTPQPHEATDGALPPDIPSPPYAGPSNWYERLLSGPHSKTPPPPPTRKGKERVPISPWSSDHSDSTFSADSIKEPWPKVWDTPKSLREGTLRSTARPLTDGAASSDSSEASFYTAPGHVKRDMLPERAEKMVTASPCRFSPTPARLCTN
jgi:hypothetical protein